MRSGRREEVDEDPFADLARIIGFDPRVKVQPAAGIRAAPPAAKQYDDLTPSQAQVQPAAEDLPATGQLADGEDAFSDADLALNDADMALGEEDSKPELFDLSDIGGTAFEAPASPAAETIFDEAEPSEEPQPDHHTALPGDFETAAEVDLVTRAFERAWQQTSQWSTEIETKDFRIPLPLEPEATAGGWEAAPESHSEPDTADELSAIDLLGEDLDDVLAQSIERDLEDAWLQPLDNPEVEIAEPESVATPAENLVVESRRDEPAEADAPDGDLAADMAALGFEDELHALLEGLENQGRQRQTVALDSVEGAPATSDAELPAVAATDESVSNEMSLPDPLDTAELDAAEKPQQPAPAPDPEPAPRLETPRHRAFSLDVGSLDDDPFAALAAMAERYRSSRPAPVDKPPAPTAPAGDPEIQENLEVEDMKRTPSARYETPEIETFDVPERAVAAADDLDFPETPFDEPHARARRGGVDDEFADLLEEMSSGEPARHNAYRPHQPDHAQARAPARMPERPVARRAYEPPRAATPVAEQSWDLDPRSQSGEENEDFFSEEDVTSIAGGQDDSVPPRKRGKWLAALFGSVVIAGGAGAFAMKFTGISDGGLPILVKADASPIKIRPDKPGGATVPNQDNEVYDRVAGNSGVTPAQEKLLSSAEEPVSLDDDQGFDDDGLPGLDMGEEIDAEPEAKAEDRLADDAAEAPRPSEEPIAVTPRKVRTMAVRADGTLVQNDPPAPVVETLVASAGQAIAKVREGSAGVDVTGSTNSIAPAAVDDQAAAPISAAAAPKVVEAQAAAGAWSMQIASQPSEDAARSSYADLAKRYSAVLAGRNVNIIKTEITGKGTFWRVRVPAETRSAAVDLCTNYKAAGGNCFVSK